MYFKNNCILFTRTSSTIFLDYIYFYLSSFFSSYLYFVLKHINLVLLPALPVSDLWLCVAAVAGGGGRASPRLLWRRPAARWWRVAGGACAAAQ